jgi:hypothetical protein
MIKTLIIDIKYPEKHDLLGFLQYLENINDDNLLFVTIEHSKSKVSKEYSTFSFFLHLYRKNTHGQFHQHFMSAFAPIFLRQKKQT